MLLTKYDKAFKTKIKTTERINGILDTNKNFIRAFEKKLIFENFYIQCEGFRVILKNLN